MGLKIIFPAEKTIFPLDRTLKKGAHEGVYKGEISMRYEDLDTATRRLMKEELEMDVQNNRIYVSPRLNEKGESTYPNILRDAVINGNDKTMAQHLRDEHLIKETEKRHNPLGGVFEMKVPESTPEILADGEFNRYYIRALCRKAINEGIRRLKIVAEKPEHMLTDDNKAKVGRIIDPHDLLDDLRQNSYVNSRFGIPSPNSGLSIEFF